MGKYQTVADTVVVVSLKIGKSLISISNSAVFTMALVLSNIYFLNCVATVNILAYFSRLIILL